MDLDNDEYVSDNEAVDDDEELDKLLDVVYRVKDAISQYVAYEGLPICEYLTVGHIEWYVKRMMMHASSN